MIAFVDLRRGLRVLYVQRELDRPPATPEGSERPARAWQFIDLADLGTTRKRTRHEALWIAPEGRSPAGLTLRRIGCGSGATRTGSSAGSIDVLPHPSLAAAVYRLIAKNRHRMPGGSPACALPPPASTRPSQGPKRSSGAKASQQITVGAKWM